MFGGSLTLSSFLKAFVTLWVFLAHALLMDEHRTFVGSFTELGNHFLQLFPVQNFLHKLMLETVNVLFLGSSGQKGRVSLGFLAAHTAITAKQVHDWANC